MVGADSVFVEVRVTQSAAIGAIADGDPETVAHFAVTQNLGVTHWTPSRLECA
jgi:hypothetical protein